MKIFYLLFFIAAVGNWVLDLIENSIRPISWISLIIGLLNLFFFIYFKYKNKMRLEDQEGLYSTAIHEAGHAIVFWQLFPKKKIKKISIKGNRHLLGEVIHDFVNGNCSKKEKLDQIKIKYAGKAAEEVILGQMYEGSSDDFKQATDMLFEAYFYDIFFPEKNVISFSTSLYGKNDTLKQMHLPEIEEIGKKMYEDTKHLIKVHEEIVKILAKLLVEKKELNEKELKEFFEENFEE